VRISANCPPAGVEGFAVKKGRFSVEPIVATLTQIELALQTAPRIVA
jgi:hypothetical protein